MKKMVECIIKKCLLLIAGVGFSLLSYAGHIDTVCVHSTAMNAFVNVTVVSPTDNASQHPVVYLLHGAYGNHFSWLEIKPDLPRKSDELGLIFVTPEAHNTWYFDSPVHAEIRYESFLTNELVNYIDTHYTTIPARRGRAIAGLSMGGHGALFCAMRHKDVYGAAGSMSGGVDFRPFPLNWNIQDELGEMAANKKIWDEHVVVNQIDKIENGDLALIVDCGEQDFFLEVNKSLHLRLLGKGIDHDFTTRPGGHDSTYWANSLDYQLLFFIKYFNEQN